MRPFILKQKYPVGDTVVICADLADYLPDPSACEDAAPVIQKAIDEIASIGGGVLYIPEGTYALRTPLTVRTAVTLRGEWISPEVEPPVKGKGTVFECFFGKNDPDGTPQVTLSACSGIQCVTFYYPEQSFENPVPYSPTVRQNGVDSATIEFVTMINPWRGMQCGPDANELHYLHNVYMTPMHEGLFMDRTTDIGRMYHFIISPDFYASFVEGTDIEALRSYMLKQSTGVFMARSDWEYGYDIRVSYCHVGFLITTLTDSAPNTQISSLHMYNCDVGFELIDVNPYGVALSDSTIVCDRPGLTCAIRSDQRFKTVMQVCGTDFKGPYPYMVCHRGSGQLSFSNCTFEGFTEAAFFQNAGGLTLLQNTFGKAGPGISHIVLEDGIGGTLLCANKFSGGLSMKASEEAKKHIKQSELSKPLSLPPKGGHKPFTGRAHPSSDMLYLVTDYGAKGDGAEDCTGAFTSAISDARKTGGIVYVPAGRYRIDGHLHLPSNVQLRGVFQVPCHTLGGGSVLMTYAGKGHETGKPFITAAQDSGLFGLVIYHPEQDAANPYPYPWAFQARGPRCYLVNTVFVNPWLGADFATYPSEGHYISYISGAPIRIGVYCGNNAGEGWVENIQYNPHYFFRTDLPNKPTKWHEFWNNQIKYLEALKFGYNENEHVMGTFVFAAHHGLIFVLQDGKGTSGKVIGHGTDGGQNGLCHAGCGNLDLINTELVTIQAPRDRVYFLSRPDAQGELRVFNTLMWGAPHRAVVLNGGNVELQLTNIVDPGTVAMTVNGGHATIAGTFFYRPVNNVEINGGECQLVSNMTVRRRQRPQPDGTPGELLPHEPALDIFQSDGQLEEIASFSK